MTEQRTPARTPSPRCPQCAGFGAELVDIDVKIQRTVTKGPQAWLLSTWRCLCGRRWVTH